VSAQPAFPLPHSPFPLPVAPSTHAASPRLASPRPASPHRLQDSCCGDQDHGVAFGDYGEMRDALNATGRPVYFSLCGWNTWYAPRGDRLGNSWRIAGDGTNWGALSQCMNKNAPLQQYAAPGAW